MTTLEKGKFVKLSVRTIKNGRQVKVPHSNRIGYSKADIEEIEPKIDARYWEAWSHFLSDKKQDEALQKQYEDYRHYLFALKIISDSDIKKYALPTSSLVV